jgi:hypothetical protein
MKSVVKFDRISISIDVTFVPKISHFPLFLCFYFVFDATFNNLSAISWRSVLLEDETEVPGEDHRPVTSQ